MSVFTDLKSAWRSLRSHPWYSLLAVIIFSFGMIATTTMFALVKNVLWDPLPYPNSDRLMVVRESKLPEFPSFSVAPGKFVIWQRDSKSFAKLAMTQNSSAVLTGLEQPLRLQGRSVTEDYFNVLDRPLLLGRAPLAAEYQQKANVLVLGETIWRRQYAADPNVLGRAISLDGKPFIVIGVAANNVNSKPDYYLPWRLSSEEANTIGGHYTNVIGRLRDGVSLAQARAEFEQIARATEQSFPAQSMGWRILIDPWRELLLRDVASQLYLLMGGALLVLLICAINVASFTLVRTSQRVAEFATRQAHGARNSQLARLMLLENLLIALLSAVVSLLICAALLPWIKQALALTVPRIEQLALSPSLVLFCLLVSTGVGALAAILPIRFLRAKPLAQLLRESGRGVSQGQRHWRDGMIIGEVALAIMLLIGSALVGRSLLALGKVDPGFASEARYFSTFEIPSARYDNIEKGRALVENLRREISAIPGVQNLSFSTTLPTVDDTWYSLQIQGRPVPEPGQEPSTIYYVTDANFFQTLGMTLKRGRYYDASDHTNATPVIVVSENFASKYFPGADAMGQKIQLGNGDERWLEIIGVVGDTKQYGLDGDSLPQLYQPMSQALEGRLMMTIQTGLPASELTSRVQQAFQRVDADLPFESLSALNQSLGDSIASRKLLGYLISLFASIAVLLAAFGLYSTVAVTVSLSLKDIATRMALGANGRAIMRSVLGRGLRLGSWGAGAGLVITLLAAKLLQSQVFAISIYDPLSYLLATTLVLIITLLACAVPALWAARTNPIKAMRMG